jgi:pimeloyl-ACP methyl ester carboxylesterase
VKTARSADGTSIAYEAVGNGPPLIVIGGAFSHRSWKGYLQLAELLSPRFTVINYDRRGRGDSGDAPSYAVEREIEDLDALVRAAGGKAHVFGMSSGGVLGLRAAAAGVRLDRLAIYQPPFAVDASAHVAPARFGEHLSELVAADRRSRAVSYFMREGMGAPRILASMLRLVVPMWSTLKSVAHTLPYDYAVMGETVGGRPLDPQPWASITTPVLVIDGGKSPDSLRRAADEIAVLLPHSRRRTLEGQSHNVSMKVLAPVLLDCLAER